VRLSAECLAALTKKIERETSREGCVPDHMHHWVRGTAAAKYRRVYSRALISAAIPHLIYTSSFNAQQGHLQGSEAVGQSGIQFVSIRLWCRPPLSPPRHRWLCRLGPVDLLLYWTRAACITELES
jgi:hypothetical protein